MLCVRVRTYVFTYICTVVYVHVYKYTHACTCCIKVNFTLGRKISCFCNLVSNIAALYRYVAILSISINQGPRMLPLNIRTCNYSCNHKLMTSSIINYDNITGDHQCNYMMAITTRCLYKNHVSEGNQHDL